MEESIFLSQHFPTITRRSNRNDGNNNFSDVTYPAGLGTPTSVPRLGNRVPRLLIMMGFWTYLLLTGTSTHRWTRGTGHDCERHSYFAISTGRRAREQQICPEAHHYQSLGTRFPRRGTGWSECPSPPGMSHRRNYCCHHFCRASCNRRKML